ncbi:hypothetical protein ASD79_22665 [Caulobacter sp. Root655]|uniref:hypothetical protein n=1 Tax=Caulobacter sp. Root655 TaxID=1736578 RepID=UPI0006F274DF|nr:hypothetical protein [Caulobacter sp. Root655]KRA61986.1 hypothetical protein ASD79_22665 [Caulobacter sp. Root655]
MEFSAMNATMLGVLGALGAIGVLLQLQVIKADKAVAADLAERQKAVPEPESKPQPTRRWFKGTIRHGRTADLTEVPAVTLDVEGGGGFAIIGDQVVAVPKALEGIYKGRRFFWSITDPNISPVSGSVISPSAGAEFSKKGLKGFL